MSEQSISNLFTPIKLNDITLQNRIAMAPMTRSRAIGNLPNELIANYYRQRASAGLIITEGTAPSPNALGYPRIPGIFSAEQVAAWKQVTDAVHQEGGKIFMQLMHVGRIAHPDNMPEGAKVLSASGIAAQGDMWTDTKGLQPNATPQAMTKEDIEEAIEEFATASANAIAAGFDGVELHGANGYLLEQFLNPGVNNRDDDYGGSVANRIKFVLEVAARVSERIGKEKTGIRLSPFNTFNGMPEYDDVVETYTQLVAGLEKLGLAYIHIIDYAANMNAPELVGQLRKAYSGILILNGGYTQERANDVLQKGLADMVSFGSTFIANPDLPYRLQHNVELAQPDTSLFYTPGAEGFTDYPFAKN